MRYIVVILFYLLSILSPRFLKAQEDILGLSEAIQIALENNYDLKIAGLDAEIAELRNDWGIAGRYPTVEFGATNSNSIDTDENSTIRANLDAGLRWVLFDGFRVNITKNQLELREDLSESILALNIENTIEDIILAFNDVILQRQRLEVFRKLMDLSYDRYEYEMRKHELGGSVTYNVLQAKNIYLADKAMFLRQEVEVKNALRGLRFIMGVDSGATWEIKSELDIDTSEYILSDLQQKMLANNHILRNQYLNQQLSEKETELRKSDLYPSLSLSAGVQNSYIRNVFSGGDPVNSNSLGPYLNFNLNYLIFNGGARKRNIDVAEINEEITEVEIEQVEHNLINELFTIYDNYRVRVELLNISQQGIEAAELNLQIAEEKFKSGVINSFNYRDIQLIYLNAALEKINATYSLIATHAALTRITGGFVSRMETE